MEWIEAQGPTVEGAVKAAIAELGLSSPDQATIEIIQEPTTGFLGLGGKEAIVKVSRKPKRSRRRRGRGGRGNGGQSKSSGGDRPSETPTEKGARPSPTKSKKTQNRRNRSSRPTSREESVSQQEEPRPEPASIETQAEVAAEFLTGLLDAFGLEGTVETRTEDDILWIDVSGGQTEALVGPKGSVLQSVVELTRTVIQRKTYGAPRMRVDISGYAERRREALGIYTNRLAERLKADGGEIMLEPMNAADRKVVHDTVVEIEGVRSLSEGEEPNRAVVLSLEEGFQPTATTEAAAEEPTESPAAPGADDPSRGDEASIDEDGSDD